MATKELLGPAEPYVWGQNQFDVLETCFQQLKTDVNGRHGWNRPIEQLDGLTLNFVGENMVKLSHAKYIVNSPHYITTKEKPEAQMFLDNMVKELVKKYKEASSKNLKMKMESEQQDLQLYSKLSGDRSWAFGTSWGPALARYMLTTNRIYSVKV